KFFLYTLFGSVLMLVAILYFYFAADPHSFDMTQLGALLAKKIPLDVQVLLWVALFIGFAIKIPAFPFHTWLPDAHVEAPTAISVILAGILLKMGTYGILRINYGILPAATLPSFPSTPASRASPSSPRWDCRASRRSSPRRSCSSARGSSTRASPSWPRAP